MRTAALLTVVTFLAAAPSAFSAGPQREEQAVRRVAMDFANVFRAQGATPIEKLDVLLDEEFVRVAHNGRTVKGKAAGVQAITSSLKRALAQIPDFQETYDIRSVQLLGRVAVVSGHVAITGTVQGQERPFKNEAWMTLVIRKRDAAWRIVHETFVFLGQTRKRPAQ